MRGPKPRPSVEESSENLSVRSRVFNRLGTASVRNLCWSFANEGCRAVSIGLVAILLARHLGPTDYGVLVFGLSIVKIGWVVAKLGLDRILVREFVLRPEASSGTLWRALAMKSLADVSMYVSLILIGLLAFRNAPEARWVIWIGGLALLFQPFDAFENLFQARERLKLVFWGKTVPAVFAAVLKGAAMLAGAGLLAFAALETVSAGLVATGLAAAYGLALRGGVRIQRETPARCGNLLRDALPLLVSALAVTIYVRSDLIMIGAMRGEAQTGIYAAAAQFSELWNILPVAIAPAVLPLLLRHRQQDVEIYSRRLNSLVQMMTLAGIVLALASSLFAGPIVAFLYGDAYTAATSILRIHVWSLVFVFLGVVQSLWDVGEKLFWASGVRTVTGALLNVALNLLLIPPYGGLGAAVATLVAYAVSGFLLNAVFSRTRSLFAMQVRALALVPLLRSLCTVLRPQAR